MKEREKFQNSNIFEGMVSFRSVISSICSGSSDRKILKVFYDKQKIQKNIREFSFIKAKSYELGYDIETVEKAFIDEMTLGNSHGGLAFICSERSYANISEDHIIENGFYVNIDGIEDPYNFGYAIRSLYASGASGIIISKRNWLGASGIVCRSSAGASETIPLFISESDEYIDVFKKCNYKIVCADMKNSIPMYEADLRRPLLLIVGGEKRGISGSILTKADIRVSIEYGTDFLEALSAASASTVLSFEVYRQNR